MNNIAAIIDKAFNMKSKFYSFFLVLLSIGCVTTSGVVQAECRLPDEAFYSLSGKDLARVLKFHDRIRTSEAKAKPQPAPKHPAVPPIPPDLGSPNGGGSNGYINADEYSNYCSALFSWITDTYNSAFCHLKHAIVEQDLAEHVDCLSSYPGSPKNLRNLIRVYSVATDDEPLQAILQQVYDDLANYIGEETICREPATMEQYQEEISNFVRAKAKLDREIEEYSERY